jgi:hypothetical protein
MKTSNAGIAAEKLVSECWLFLIYGLFSLKGNGQQNY